MLHAAWQHPVHGWQQRYHYVHGAWWARRAANGVGISAGVWGLPPPPPSCGTGAHRWPSRRTACHLWTGRRGRRTAGRPQTPWGRPAPHPPCRPQPACVRAMAGPGSGGVQAGMRANERAGRCVQRVRACMCAYVLRACARASARTHVPVVGAAGERGGDHHLSTPTPTCLPAHPPTPCPHFSPSLTPHARTQPCYSPCRPGNHKLLELGHPHAHAHPQTHTPGHQRWSYVPYVPCQPQTP